MSSTHARTFASLSGRLKSTKNNFLQFGSCIRWATLQFVVRTSYYIIYKIENLNYVTYELNAIERTKKQRNFFEEMDP